MTDGSQRRRARGNISQHVQSIPSSGHPPLLRPARQHGRRHLARRRPAGLRDAEPHPPGRHQEHRRRRDVLHVELRPRRAAGRHLAPPQQPLRRPLRRRHRDHRHGRRQRGAEHRARGDPRSRATRCSVPIPATSPISRACCSPAASTRRCRRAPRTASSSIPTSSSSASRRARRRSSSAIRRTRPAP